MNAMNANDLKPSKQQAQTICPNCRQPNQCALVEQPETSACWCMQIEPMTNSRQALNSTQANKVCLCKTCLMNSRLDPQ
ncbi:cysteine-rich CWC family protein [Simiduia curdlanivorans]|uniref:Cysteine-rich CWC family protein n=1 Tax=Simiduia curdlanivorans TaxID=1492769 RepID=A0ABV8V429_9GAMM|nr:cysteine-rich CWC family protein [Simiduia curdlanivorans]MDN3641005.1 cysteine-rich CWC family protein [Simiduia curdlanivorans]